MCDSYPTLDISMRKNSILIKGFEFYFVIEIFMANMQNKQLLSNEFDPFQLIFRLVPNKFF